jgi:hypothetical protein
MKASAVRTATEFFFFFGLGMAATINQAIGQAPFFRLVTEASAKEKSGSSTLPLFKNSSGKTV